MKKKRLEIKTVTIGEHRYRVGVGKRVFDWSVADAAVVLVMFLLVAVLVVFMFLLLANGGGK